VQVGDLVKYLGTVAYGRGIGIVVEVQLSSVGFPRIRIFAPRATKSGYIVQIQHNLELVSENR
jgi:hypothetical protein